MATVEERVKMVLMDLLGVSKESLTPEANLVKDLGADSLDLTEVVMAMEEEFEVEIDEDAAQNLTTVEQIIKYVQEKINNN